MFIRDQWYIAGWDHEVGRKPLARTICGEPVVLYRSLAGVPVALYDACPHRLLPLSMGMLEGDNLRCKYHGMLFDGAERKHNHGGTRKCIDLLPRQILPEHNFLTCVLWIEPDEERSVLLYFLREPL